MSTRISPVISAILTPLLVISPLWAQTPVPLNNSPLDNAAGQSIQLSVVANDGAQVQVNSLATKGFTVHVSDATGAGISDAAVVFRLPDSGPTGVFTDGTHSAVVYTAASGNARVTGIQWKETPGALLIRVTANKGMSHAGILIEQTLSSATELTAAITAVAPTESPLPVGTPSLPAPVPGTVLSTTGASASVSPQNETVKPIPSTSIAKVDPESSVSVTSASPGTSQHSGKMKWLIIAAIAAGAGVGVAMAERGKSNNNTSASASTLSIGAPTVSVGHP